MEETAWQFIPEAIVGIYRWHNTDTNITFLRTCFTGSVNNFNPDSQLDEGILGTKWLSYEEILSRSLRSPLVTQCIEDYFSGIRYPLGVCKEVL